MVYYHLGRILEIFSPTDKDVTSSDTTTQALVETWDENIMTFRVDAKISTKLKKDDYVLLDYNPMSEKIAIPRMIVIKIIKGPKAKKAWNAYKSYFKKRAKVKATEVPPKQQPYIG